MKTGGSVNAKVFSSGRLCGAFATDNRHKAGDALCLVKMDRHVRVGNGRVDCSGHVPNLYL
jgi:hypothetical protein